MPRKKEDRNPFGTILEKTVMIDGKPRKVWDVRKRYAATDENGAFIFNEKGKKIYKDKTQRCYSKSEANAAISGMPIKIEVKKQKESGTFKKNVRRTFRELALYFKKEYCKPAVIAQNRVVAGYRQNFENIIAYTDEYLDFFGDLPLNLITYEHVRAFAEHLATTPIKPGFGHKQTTRLPKVATVNRKLSYLRRIFNIGIRLRWLTVNPFHDGEPLIHADEEEERKRILTFQEEKQLLAACEMKELVINTTRYDKPLKMVYANPWRKMKLILIMAIDTGLRSKEIFALERRFVDMENLLINAPANITKGWKARTIPISARLQIELEKHFHVFKLDEKDPVFLGQKSCKKSFRTLCEYCGIVGLTFHDLRHTATSWMDEAGISSAAKKNIVGHSSETVHQRYHNQSEDLFESVRKKMDSFQRRRDKTKPAKKDAA